MHHVVAAYSTLAGEQLARLLAAEYSLTDPQVVLLRRAFNDNYRVTAGEERYILRVYLHDKYYISGPDDLRFELDLLDHLAAEGVGVATAVPRTGGDKLGTIQAPEGVRYYALFRYAPGAAVDRPTEAQTRALGEALARLHLAADRFQSGHPRHSLDLKALLDASMERLAPYLAGRPAEFEFLHATAGRIRRRLTNLELSQGGWGIIHGDPHAGNSHFVGDRPVLFDFDTCGYGFRGYDVSIFMAEREYEHRPAFLEAYQSVRPLSAAEVAAMATFTRARVIWNAGDILTLAHIWGESTAVRVVNEMLDELRQLDAEHPE